MYADLPPKMHCEYFCTMMEKVTRAITDVARYAVGILFIFSGIIKANDPLGFSYKLEEYFEEIPKISSHLSFSEPLFHFLHAWALPQAIFLVILEVVLGIAVIVRYRVQFTAFLLLLLIVFFTFLTFASWHFEIVRSCGCFGDAIPLTPFESFMKDVVLLVLIGIIFWQRNKIAVSETNLNDYVLVAVGLAVLLWLCSQLEWLFPFTFTAISIGAFLLIRLFDHIKAPALSTTLATAGMGLFTFYTYTYLPVRDFRAYAPGKSIREQMQGIPDKLKYFYRLKDKKTGEIKEFEKFPANYQEQFDFVESRTEVIEKGVEPKIMDFAINHRDGYEVTDDILQDEGYSFLLVSYNLALTYEGVQEKINSLASEIQKDGHRFICLTSSSHEMADEFAKRNKSTFEYYFADEVTLKTIIRSNPGLVLIKNGVVVQQWSHSDLPDMATLKAEYLK